MTNAEKITRSIGIAACETFAVITIIMLFVNGQYNRLPLAFATLLIVLIPEIVERLFRCKISLPIYLFGLLYAIGPMLGQCYNLYYTVSWWDKMLHFMGGVMFAIFGFYLFERFAGAKRRNMVFSAVFAVCFSMAIAVLWEFCEFGADSFLGMDMQDDMVISSFNSFLLNNEIGEVGTLENIKEVVVDGKVLPVDGYIDIGLIDSMLDMLLETIGAIVTAVIVVLDKGRHPLFASGR